MTDSNKTSITVILDKSGSMQSVRTDTVGGYNTFIESQKNLPGECEVTLIQFNDNRVFTYKSINVKNLEKGLSLDDYQPTGGTALLDAVGVAINEKGAEFAALPEDQRPGKVIFVIITDGNENASNDFDYEKIKEMIEHQQKVYSWDFTFLGANIDTFSVAGLLGIMPDKSLSFSTTSIGGSLRAFASVSNYTMTARTSENLAGVSYSTVDRSNNSI